MGIIWPAIYCKHLYPQQDRWAYRYICTSFASLLWISALYNYGINPCLRTSNSVWLGDEQASYRRMFWLAKVPSAWNFEAQNNVEQGSDGKCIEAMNYTHRDSEDPWWFGRDSRAHSRMEREKRVRPTRSVVPNVEDGPSLRRSISTHSLYISCRQCRAGVDVNLYKGVWIRKQMHTCIPRMSPYARLCMEYIGYEWRHRQKQNASSYVV